VRHGVETEDGAPVTESRIRSMAGSLVDRLEGEENPYGDRLPVARKVFEDVALGESFVEFLTLPAYELIN
jgi:malate synthase